jgi:hypothetical protein
LLAYNSSNQTYSILMKQHIILAIIYKQTSYMKEENLSKVSIILKKLFIKLKSLEEQTNDAITIWFANKIILIGSDAANVESTLIFLK